MHQLPNAGVPRKCVARYEQTKGSLHFSSDKPLPIALVRKLIKVRIAQTTE
jgi:uncharacterized protein YdhG (YjbR/CyaY superfamily)